MKAVRSLHSAIIEIRLLYAHLREWLTRRDRQWKRCKELELIEEKVCIRKSLHWILWVPLLGSALIGIWNYLDVLVTVFASLVPVDLDVPFFTASSSFKRLQGPEAKAKKRWTKESWQVERQCHGWCRHMAAAHGEEQVFGAVSSKTIQKQREWKRRWMPSLVMVCHGI